MNCQDENFQMGGMGTYTDSRYCTTLHYTRLTHCTALNCSALPTLHFCALSYAIDCRGVVNWGKWSPGIVTKGFGRKTFTNGVQLEGNFHCGCGCLPRIKVKYA